MGKPDRCLEERFKLKVSPFSQAILSESVKVFELNNSVIRSVEGINKVLLRRFFKFFIAVMLLLFFFLAYFFKTATEIEFDGDIFDDLITSDEL